ncbi:MAG: SpoIIE family protein phosphatase [Bryobacteraceae bacterium]
MPSPKRRNFRVLAVDDNATSRRMIAGQLSRLGFEVTLAGSAEEAKDILIRESSALHCLVTDCYMPGQSGLDLLGWLKDYDFTLASVVVSGESEEDLVGRTLRGGASDFVKKPVSLADLEAALSKGIHSTQRRRRAAATQMSVRDAGILQRRMNNLHGTVALPTPVTLCYHPKFEAGGDSVAFFPFDSDRLLVLASDVSGHDLRSALLSAYFQGMVRGMVEQNVPIGDVLNHFNSFLVNDWTEPSSTAVSCPAHVTSLSVCSVLVDLKFGTVSLSSSGFPLPARIGRDGVPWTFQLESGYPLGWFDPNPVSSLQVETRCGDHLVVWTDGLEDFANQLEISPWSLAYRLLETGGSAQTPEWLADSEDDVLLLHIPLDRTDSVLNQMPVLDETYQKTQLPQIDDLQIRWRSSLQFAFPKIKKYILFDILLCIRETVINGLLHGCRTASDICRLTVVMDREKQCLRIDVADPGPGHQFNVSQHAALASEELVDEHRGLLLIHRMADKAELERNGASVRLFFNLQKESSPQLLLS